MSNDFLHLSPSRNLIDPLIYHNFDEDKKSKKNDTPSDSNGSGSSSGGSSSNNNINTNTSNNNNPSVPPSASKFHNGSNFTGWTPLISKTYFNDQLMSFNSTPNKHFFPSNPNMSSEFVDYSQGLNLTPFLTHNINILNNGHPSATSNSINQQLSNITPFHDKTLHLADFLMDSPIRKTPIKDLDTITPSKFRIGSEKKLLKQSIFQDPKSASKRSITQIDTPPRQPHKLSITTKAERSNDDVDNETDSKANTDTNEEGSTTESEDEDKENKRLEIPKSTKYYLQTPSKKVLHDISNLRKTPLKSTPLKIEHSRTVAKGFQTPAQHAPSSPSTVILSSAVKENIESQETDDEEDEQENRDHPPSPTPNKDKLKAEPVMGVFSERKPKANLGSRNISRASNPSRPQEFSEGVPGKGKNNKARMQAGMNKFQIVFTDVHALMNNKNKKEPATVNSKKKSETEKPKAQRPLPQQPNQSLPQTNQNQYSVAHLHPSSQDHNVTMNTSKEISMTSGTTSMNNSHLNISSGTDHSSFEMGGISSTPNGKFFLDKILEKPSPQSHQLFNQGNNYYSNQQYSMLPPHKQPQSQSQPPQRNPVHHPHQSVPQQIPQHQISQHQQQQHPMMMMMMMSTPQHQNVVHYSPQIYNSETSPTEANDSSNQIGVPYQNLQVYSKDMNHSPQNYSMINMNGQSVMMPLMMNKSDMSQYNMAQSDELLKDEDSN